MNPFANITTTVNIIVSLGVLIAGVGYAYGQFWGGRKKQASEQTIANTALINGLQTQLDGFEKLVAALKAEHKEEMEKLRSENIRLTKELGELTGQVREKESKLAEYKEIFQGRDPNNEAFTKLMTESVVNTAKCFDSITKTLLKLEQWTEKLDRNLEKIIN